MPKQDKGGGNLIARMLHILNDLMDRLSERQSVVFEQRE